MLSPNQIFVVVDVETDGPAVGLNSMLSLGAVATNEKQDISQFYRKLSPLKGANKDPQTMHWWEQNHEAWVEATHDPQEPHVVMNDFYLWIEALNSEPIFVANPIGLDYTFVSWYLYRFAPKNPFISNDNAIRTLDIRSFIAGIYGFSYDESSRLKWPSKITQDLPIHTHRAIDDAIGYAFLLRKLIDSYQKV